MWSNYSMHTHPPSLFLVPYPSLPPKPINKKHPFEFWRLFSVWTLPCFLKIVSHTDNRVSYCLSSPSLDETECSASSLDTATMKYLRTNSLKRLFSLKRRSLEDIVYTDGEGRNSENTKIVQEPKLSPRPSWKCFSFEEISDATNGFSQGSLHLHCKVLNYNISVHIWVLQLICYLGVLENLVGRGGYAEVYKGVLCGGEEIAIKRLTKACRDERKEKDFLTEIGTIGHVCHPNVLSLLGCCTDNGLYLIFHFSSRGSVASLLHGTEI